MTFLQQQLRLYAVTDTRWLRPGETLETVVEALLRGGVTMVQLRDKHADRQQLCAALLPVCRRYGAPLIINDYPDVAREVDADGVHVGQDDMAYAQARRLLGADKIIGVSAHNPEEALAAQAAGADYLGCGAVFGSATKR